MNQTKATPDTDDVRTPSPPERKAKTAHRQEPPLLLGPFPLQGEGLQGVLERLLHPLAALLHRLESRASRLETERRALAAVPLEPGGSALSVMLQRTEAGVWLEGFVVHLGPSYLQEDWGRIEHEPPVVRPLLNALAEQLWWTLLRPFVPFPCWTPLLLLEWSPELSVRAGFHPEGALTLIRLELEVHETRHKARYRLVGGPEIEMLHPRGRQEVLPPVDQPELAEVFAPLESGHPASPETTQAAQGESAPPLSELERESVQAVVLELTLARWWPHAVRLERSPGVSDPHRRAPVRLGLPSRREGGAEVSLQLLNGWAGVGLEGLPRRDGVALAFQDQPLRELQLGSPRWARALSGLWALGISLVLSALAFGVLSFLSQVRAEQEQRLAPPAPLPALSFCSEDNQRFVNALRAWILKLSPNPDIVLGEVEPDLTPVFCGLLDRVHTLDWNAGTQAAANACFDVLKTPTYGYTLETTPAWAANGWGNPKAFFDDEQTRVDSLDRMLRGMKDACALRIRQLEVGMKRTVVRTHLSSELLGAHPLLGAAAASHTPRAMSNLPTLWKRLRADAPVREQAGDLEAPRPLPALASRASMPETAASAQRWLERYMMARFQPYDPVERIKAGIFRNAPQRLLPYAPLWRCYLSLQPEDVHRALLRRERQLPEDALGEWEARVLFPGTLDRPVGDDQVGSQVHLDGILRWLNGAPIPEQGAGSDAWQCWGVVQEELSRQGYTPVHPLLQPTLDEWPAPSQQVCGQVCAAMYGLDGSTSRANLTRSGWLASGQDLRDCLASDRFREVADEPEGPALELDMGWAGAGRRQTVAQACAFHLLAQERIRLEPERGGAGGAAPETPLGAVPPQVWAGGTDGSARTDSSRSYLVFYARQLSTWRRQGSLSSPRSVEGCRYVGAQCLTAAMLASLDRSDGGGFERGYARDARMRFRDEIARSLRVDPWCQLIEEELTWLFKNDFRLEDKRAEDLCLGRIATTEQILSSTLDRLARQR